ncbi:hypothetical protein AB0M95_04395 [Sphaerisporangium sp. NPDC051017]|uniref:hypothetical protein n=1 Tax=Sphaerisporangium sp. NPDC051017 TaxID=3154636 RepID=UPI003417AA17
MTVVLVLLTPVVLTACAADTGPTATQAGQTLKYHILQLLKESNAKNVTITDPGGKNLSCSDSKVRQTFAASAVDSEPKAKSQIVKDGLVSALGRVAPYKIVTDGFDDGPIRLENTEAATVLYLSSSLDGRIDVRGQTQCLPAS